MEEKTGGRNIEVALWEYKNREFNQVDVFLSKHYPSPRVLLKFSQVRMFGDQTIQN